MKFAIQCFDRCSQLPGKNFKTIRDGGKIWKEVTSVIMEPCVTTVLKHLVHGKCCCNDNLEVAVTHARYV